MNRKFNEATQRTKARQVVSTLKSSDKTLVKLIAGLNTLIDQSEEDGLGCVEIGEIEELFEQCKINTKK